MFIATYASTSNIILRVPADSFVDFAQQVPASVRRIGSAGVRYLGLLTTDWADHRSFKGIGVRGIEPLWARYKLASDNQSGLPRYLFYSWVPPPRRYDGA